jgi:hypothetical protein
MRKNRYDLPPRSPVAGYPCYFGTETLGLTKEHMQQAAEICGHYEYLDSTAAVPRETCAETHATL